MQEDHGTSDQEVYLIAHSDKKIKSVDGLGEIVYNSPDFGTLDQGENSKEGERRKISYKDRLFGQTTIDVHITEEMEEEEILSQDNCSLIRLSVDEKTLKIDSTTTCGTRGKFVRIYVEVDLTKPLISKFWLRRRVRRMEYEGLHLVCFSYGKYGHHAEICPFKELAKDMSPRDTIGNLEKTKDTQPEQVVPPEVVQEYGL